jgi:GNAT superfamily N-acetyltransferase
MSVIEIRPATPDDKHSLLHLLDAHADFEQMPRPTPEARERLLRDGFGDQSRFSAFLASLDGRDVGYAITYEAYSSFLARPILYLEDIFVYEEARGKGFGGAMFQHLVNEAVQRGCARMEWMVVDWNDNAIGFYQRRGAEPLDDWRTYRLDEAQMKHLVRRRGAPVRAA